MRRVIGVADASRQIVACGEQSEFRVLEIHFRGGGSELELSPRFDELVDKRPLRTGDAAVVRGLHIPSDRRVGISPGLDQVSTRGLDVGSGLTQFRAIGCGQSLQIRQRVRAALGTGNLGERGGQGRQSGKQLLDGALAALPAGPADGIQALRSPEPPTGLRGSIFAFWPGASSLTAASDMYAVV